MHLIIDEYSIDMRIENNRLAIEKGNTIKSIVPSKISAIHIIKPCSLTTPVVTWAAENNIAVLLYNNKGKVTARLWQPNYGSHAAIRIMQLTFCTSAQGMMWVKTLLLQKASAQLHTLNSLPPHLRNTLVTEKIAKYINMLRADVGINQIWLRSMEAVIGRWYWAGISVALKQYTVVLPRNMRPARDRFNAILNYLYGTLYGIVEGCLLAAGLDTQLGIMHRMEYNTPALVFDVIEPFRHWADEFLIQMVLENRLTSDFTDDKSGDILLTPKGKKEVLTQWFIYLQQKTPAPKKLIKRKDQVQQLCSNLAAQLLREAKFQNSKTNSL